MWKADGRGGGVSFRFEARLGRVRNKEWVPVSGEAWRAWPEGRQSK